MPWDQPWAVGCYGDGRWLLGRGLVEQRERGFNLHESGSNTIPLTGLKASQCLLQQTPAPELHGQGGLASFLTTPGPWEALGAGGGLGSPQEGTQRPEGCEILTYKLTQNA